MVRWGGGRRWDSRIANRESSSCLVRRVFQSGGFHFRIATPATHRQMSSSLPSFGCRRQHNMVACLTVHRGLFAQAMWMVIYGVYLYNAMQNNKLYWSIHQTCMKQNNITCRSISASNSVFSRAFKQCRWIVLLRTIWFMMTYKNNKWQKTSQKTSTTKCGKAKQISDNRRIRQTVRHRDQ